MPSRKLKAISLFSGAGGMDIGVRQAGFGVLSCVEFDPNCCNTLRAAVARDKSRTRILQEDVRKIRPTRLMRELGLKRGELDLLFGGPPCQAFSQIGKRGSLGDERGLLIFEMIRFARAIRPKAVLIEQVKGILNAPDQSGRVGGALEQVIAELDALGYATQSKVLSAAGFGVPQVRKRVFIVATRKSFHFEFPRATHAPRTNALSLFALEPFVTTRDALAGLGAPSRRGVEREDSHCDVTPDGDRGRIAGVPEGSHLAKELHLPASQRQRLTKKDTTKYRRLAWDEPSLTLRCGEIFFHPEENRYLTPREYLRLHGYPDGYILTGPIRSRSGRVRDLDQHRQVANSVPPPLARALATAILEALCRESSSSSATQRKTGLTRQRSVAVTPAAHS